jgi:hypothetical protein
MACQSCFIIRLGKCWGAGDAKLWIALLWLCLLSFITSAELCLRHSLSPALAQILWHSRKQSPTQFDRRMANHPFILLCWYAH